MLRTTKKITRDRLLAGLAGAVIGTSSAAPALSATPDDNDALIAAHSVLLGGHLSGIAIGFLPWPFGLAGEIQALATDAALKATPPVFRTPASYSAEPNASRPFANPLFNCVYSFDRPVTASPINGGLEADYSSIFGIPFSGVGNAFADLGKPFVYHAQADVAVRAKSSSIIPTRAFQEFGEGVHTIDWQATTRVNPIGDIAIPLAFAAYGALSEISSARRGQAVAAQASGNSDDYAKFLLELAAESGLIAFENSGSSSALDFYNSLSFDSTSNRASQTITIWDTHVPYVVDARNGTRYIDEQAVELEATDFGGVRFGRVEGFLRNQFLPVDDCGRSQTITTDTNRLRLLEISDTPHDVVWTITESGGPYQANAAIAPHQTIGNTGVVTTFTQRIRIADTQAPLLAPPSGFSRYSDSPIDLTVHDFPLGRPQVVDLADPAPTVSNDAPDVLEVGRRYLINWSASDASGNVTSPAPGNPEQYTQVVTIKAPGTNTPPSVQAGLSASTTTSNVVDIRLAGTDADILDGRADPLSFEITDYPDNGEFQAPLLPYFIKDFRLTPLGEREEGDNLSRTSPLLHLAAGLLDVEDHGAYLNSNICEAPAGSLEADLFNNVIPTNFVYRPERIIAGDDGSYFMHDYFWVCGEPVNRMQYPEATVLSPLRRVSKWSSDGEFITMLPIEDMLLSDQGPQLDRRIEVSGEPFIGRDDQLWLPIGEKDRNTRFEVFQAFLRIDTESLTAYDIVGIDPDSEFDSVPFTSAVGDSEDGLLYIMRPYPSTGSLISDRRDRVYVYESVETGDGSFLDADRALAVFNAVEGVPMATTDIKLDSEGFVYIVDNHHNRLHKFEPAERDDNGDWQPGAYIGWAGVCGQNRLDPNGVPYSACDEARQVSLGFACTDEKCNQQPNYGGGPGQFDDPLKLVFDRNDIMYVSDRDNFRIQRLTTDGTYVGEARSTGTGINTGDQPGFMLGNFGKPDRLSISAAGLFVMELRPQFGDYFVHAFKTLPFFDVTDDAATVRYVSYFDFQGADSFSYRAFDGIDYSRDEAVSLSVARSFRPPERLTTECYTDETLAQRTPCTTDEDTPLIVRAVGFDPDGFISTGGLDSLTFSLESTVQFGDLEPLSQTDNAAVYRYTPSANYHGPDQFVFSASDGVASATEPKIAELTVEPIPDPLEINLPETLVAGRGFPMVLAGSYSDPDRDPGTLPEVVELDWGDGAVAASGNWEESGRRDLNDRALPPQIPGALGGGTLFASHTYENAGSFPITTTMRHAPSESLPDAVRSVNVDVIEATRVTASLEAPLPGALPDAAFSLRMNISNVEPEGWSGLTASNLGIAFDRPEGLRLLELPPGCTGEDRIECQLPDLAPGASSLLDFIAFVDATDAVETPNFGLVITIVDDGPKITEQTLAFLTVRMADSDGDGVIETADAFPNDPRYSADTDGDGLPDAWEILFGLNPNVADDANSDLDGDGRTLRQEFSRGASPVLADAERLLAQPLATSGSGASDLFGIRLASADFNADGYTDTIIGAPSYEGQGATFISYGSPMGAAPATRLSFAPSSSRRYGQSVAAGDFDGNGLPDLAVAASNSISVHFNNGALYDAADIALDVFDTPSALDIEVYAADLDNDNADDLLVVATLGRITTQFQLYLSSSGGLSGTPQSFITRDVAMGTSATIADIDGDGQNDLVLGGAPTDSGVVRGYLAADNVWTDATTNGGFTQSFELTPPPGTSGFGASLASGYDVDGDSITELVVGAFRNAGTVAIYRSGQSYWADPINANPELIQGTAAAPGDSAGDQFGIAVALGDLNADGLADLVVGGSRAGTLDQGELRVFHGSLSGFTETQAIPGGSDWDMLGHDVLIAGDVDGDGFPDVVAGAPDLVTPERPSPNGGYVGFWLHGFAAAAGATDPDGDRIDSQFDNCPTNTNPGQADLDEDGSGDACDLDIDGDGFLNANDNCPFVATTLQTDTDGDGLGDACDGDDDNDGTDDATDAFPLDARYTSDSDSDGMPDRFETDFGLDPNDGSDADGDLDGDGRSNREEFLAGTDIAADDVPPTVTAPADRVVAATGPLTMVDLGTATAVDVLDGGRPVTVDPAGPFRPGRLILNWSSADTAGNEGGATQQLDVLPLAEFVGTSVVAAEGTTINVAVTLNGDAPAYPVRIPLSVTGSATPGTDYSLATADLQIDSGRHGFFSIDIADDGPGDDGELIELQLGTPSNAALGPNSRTVASITEGNVAPRVEIRAQQSGDRRSTVFGSDGPVVLTAEIADPNPGDIHSFDWSATDARLIPNEGFNGSTFTFDPTLASDGVYAVSVAVVDAAGASASERLFIRIETMAPTLSGSEDSDGDGADDNAEGFADADGNGVPAWLDPFDAARWIPAGPGQSGLLQTEAGLTLRPGAAAISNGGALLDFTDLAERGNAGQPVANSEDRSHNYPAGLYDFEVHDLPEPGGTARIVIALPVPIPANALYRKFASNTGWADFDTDANNTIRSAPGAVGACPAPGSADYADGLTAGHFCVELTIEDGGPNDADGMVDGTISDPGGIAVRASGLSVMASPLSLGGQRVAPGAALVPALRLRLNSNSADIEVEALTISVSGTGNDRFAISSLRIWLDENGNGAVDAGDTELGSGSFDADDGELDIQFVSPLTLPVGDTDLLGTLDF